MPFINDEVFDGGLDYADVNGTRIDICYTQEPTTYAEATSTYTCGNKTGLHTGAPEDGETDGRRDKVPALHASKSRTTPEEGWGGQRLRSDGPGKRRRVSREIR